MSSTKGVYPVWSVRYSSPTNAQGLQKYHLMVVIPFLSSVEDASRFSQINKKCLDSLRGLRKNPCYDVDSFQSFQKELFVFNWIDTIRGKVEFIMSLPDEVLQMYTFYDAIVTNNKFNYIKLKPKISRLDLYGEFPSLKSCFSLRELTVFIEGNLKISTDEVRNVKTLQSVTIKTSAQNVIDNLEMVKALFYTKVRLVLILSGLDDKILEELSNELPNAKIAAASDMKLKKALLEGKCPVMFRDGDLLVSKTDFQTNEELTKIIKKYYPNRLDFSCDTESEFNIRSVKCSGLMLTGMASFNTMCIPSTLTALTVMRCNIENLCGLPESLVELVLRSCNKLNNVEFPHMLSQVTLDSCQRLTELSGLNNISLEKLIVGGSVGLRQLIVPTSVTSLVLAKCGRLVKLSIDKCTRLERLCLSEILCLRNLEFPDSLTQIEIAKCQSFCGTKNSLNHLKDIKLENCPMLAHFELNENAETVRVNNCSRLCIATFPSNAKFVELNSNSHLTQIRLEKCFEAKIEACNVLSSLDFGSELRSLSLKNCANCVFKCPETLCGLTVINSKSEECINYPCLTSLELTNANCTKVVVPEEVGEVKINMCSELLSLTVCTALTYPISNCHKLSDLKINNADTLFFVNCQKLHTIESNCVFQLQIIGLEEPLNVISNNLTSLTLLKAEMTQIEPITSLKALLLRGCDNLNSLPSFPNLKTLGMYQCVSMKTVILNTTLESLQIYESPLVNLTLPSSLTYLDLNLDSLVNIYKLEECTKLTSIELFNCMKVKTLNVPSNIVHLELSHFKANIVFCNSEAGLNRKVFIRYSNYPTIRKEELKRKGVSYEEGVTAVAKAFKFHNTVALTN
ncbi:hypothetical protein EIN_018260 [Entamoeba invadens IP1]|uniref:hypothetical protein n=1 Tax=Entamoeba invadens IP1 TaxID=370355 RepID=UPI0002C3D902|nr:hypothetical protein EIN_018260 [Entamoeba invadens IP1]ELP90477.1 hypothetical protein EIN_018260 [Entamoeba invadens IP1]|eukprot:XP_004257248.1 hypothetical protein EIN_018260 [Entamoeba invadens IP1]